MPVQSAPVDHLHPREPELAGVLGAVVGSALMLLVAGLIAVPVGVLAAVWLEEFAPRGRLSNFIEVNINNLAAVPSIVYGLLGLALFINWMHLPRASPIVGGLVLALMALPTLVIATPDGHRDPMYVADRIAEHGVTVTDFVPSMLTVFVANARPGSCDTLRHVFVIGEALPAETAAAFACTAAVVPFTLRVIAPLYCASVC